jgi:hypothetical protein
MRKIKIKRVSARGGQLGRIKSRRKIKIKRVIPIKVRHSVSSAAADRDGSFARADSTTDQ